MVRWTTRNPAELADEASESRKTSLPKWASEARSSAQEQGPISAPVSTEGGRES